MGVSGVPAVNAYAYNIDKRLSMFESKYANRQLIFSREGAKLAKKAISFGFKTKI